MTTELRAFGAVIALAGLAAGGIQAAPSGDSRPTTPPVRVGLAPCVDLPQLPTARCGVLRVPLDRTHPRAGTTAVALAVVPRTDQSRPSLGAIAPNPGGPGSATIDGTGVRYAVGLAPVLDRRELLLMDTRGVGRSGPVTCPALQGPARVFVGLERQRALIGRCGTQLAARVGSYGSAAVADDLDDARAAAGIDKLDLLGDSYGTFLMPVYAQRHPQHVRSIVLSGAYAVNIDPTAVGEKALRRAISLVGTRTGAYSGATAIGDLSALATRLRTSPDAVTVPYGGRSYRVSLDEWQLAGTVGSVYSGPPDEAAQLALAAAAAAARTGDLEPIRVMVRANLTTLADNYSTGPATVSDAAGWGTTCHDYPKPFDLTDSVRQRRTDFDADIAGQNPRDFGIFSARAWLTRANYDTGACLRWPADRTARTPFPLGTTLPDVPVLVLSGDLDANTPSPSGRQAAAQFPHATWVEVAGAGHTPTQSTEGLQLVLDFIAHPHR